MDVVDLISEYIQLKPAGANFKACCPFHQEKSPSFMVSRPKQIWHCFGCQNGGDIFGFVMKMEGMEFPEALRLLAEKAGVELPAHSNELSSSARNRILDILKLATKFYHKILMESSRAQTARDYLQKRGLSTSIIEEWQIGFVPDVWDTLTGFLLKKGFGINDLTAAGLTIQKPGGGNYDRFRGRIMFPLSDVHGNVVGFTGRLLNETTENAGGKYVNTPQTEVYDKSEILFGLNKAKQEIKRQDRAIIVEGQMDVIACHQAGQINVAASSGTALTLEQIKLLKRFTNNLYLAFDSDAAGQNAAERGISLALEEGTQVRVITLPPDAGKDPDECLKKNPELWFKSVDGAQLFMEYFFKKNLAGKNFTDPTVRSQVATTLLNQIAKIPDVIEQDFWLKKLTGVLDVDITLLRERLTDLRRKPMYNQKEAPADKKNQATEQNAPEIASENLMSIVLQDEEMLKIVADRLKIVALAEKHQNLFKDFLTFTQTAEKTPEKVIHRFRQSNPSPDSCQMIDILELLYEQKFAELSQDKLLNEALKIVDFLNLCYTGNIRRQIEREMKLAEEKGDSSKMTELMDKFKNLL
ncbi:MAG: primase protein [Candidatus Magasanikbacteria bacterium GW2011_GWA2_41_55]|uniref:DNA primase n=2 Tax=Candidatus Magasanikiibacteriota TaxID=1752731 RepID=A0A0G0WK11_9BACT|nr:MAG: primase protein [Candidatus Magasanikbacteria bacterium GW2011_GWA2_41_55]